MYTFLIDKFVPADQAFLHVSDLSIQRGYGIFDFFRVMDNCPLFLDDYIERFYTSAREMQLDISITPKEFGDIVFELIRWNNIPSSGIKAILTGGYSPDGYQLATPNLIMVQNAMSFPSEEFPKRGIKIITHEYVRDKPHVKTINYTVGIWIQKRVHEEKAADVLYHHKGVVSEFPRCNFFIVKQDNTLATPAENILAGVTRKHVIRLADEKNFDMEIGTVTLDDIKNAREAFLTSTSKRIVPITQMDDVMIGDGKPGNVSNILFDELIKLEHAERLAVKNKS